MTLINQNSSVTLTGNGVTTTWPYTFIIPDTASVRVGLFTIATSVLVELDPSAYTISGVGDSAGGEVEYPLVGSPIASTTRIVIWREVEYTQDTDLTNQTPYYPVVLEDQLDRIVMQVQQLAAESARSVKVSLGSTSTPDELLDDIASAVVAAEASAAASAASAITSSTEADTSAAEAVASAVSAAASAASAAAALVSENAVALAAIPVGMVTMQNGAVDAGYLRMGEGGSYDRLVYPDLAAWMDINGETAFGLSAGDVAAGVLPDWRDYVPRTAGGALGPAVGETQEDAAQQITGTMVGVVTDTPSRTGALGYTNIGSDNLTAGGGARTYGTVSFDNANSAGARTATETRVKSFGVRWQIKAYGALVNQGTADLVAIETAQQFMVRHDAQTLNATQQAQVRANIGADLLGGFRNKIINPLGTINQRGYVSGAATSGANQYTIDRWRVVTSGQNLSWSESNGVRTMTAPAGGVEQVVEGAGIIGGDYVLNWTGTATATVGGVARTKGEVFTLTGGANVTVRFTGGTFSLPQLEAGGTVTSFATRHIQQELALCQRYYRHHRIYAIGDASAASQYLFDKEDISDMRASPTIATVGADGNSNVGTPSVTIQGSGADTIVRATVQSLAGGVMIMSGVRSLDAEL